MFNIYFKTELWLAAQKHHTPHVLGIVLENLNHWCSRCQVEQKSPEQSLLSVPLVPLMVAVFVVKTNTSFSFFRSNFLGVELFHSC